MPIHSQLRSPTCLTAAAGTGFGRDFSYLISHYENKPRACSPINWVKVSLIAQNSSLLPKGISLLDHTLSFFCS